MFLNIAAQALDTADFLNVFLRFWGFWGSFSYKNFSYKKTCTSRYVMKQLLKKVQFEFPHIVSFSWNKETVSCRWNNLEFNWWCLDIILHMVNSFVVSLDSTIMINISQEILKNFHKKKLKAVNLYWLRNDAWEKNNSLNGHSNKSQE